MTKKIADKYMAMQNDLEHKANTGRLGGLTLSEFDSICDCGKELLKHHCVKTFISKVADYFKQFGFMATMDFDKIHYVIVEV